VEDPVAWQLEIRVAITVNINKFGREYLKQNFTTLCNHGAEGNSHDLAQDWEDNGNANEDLY
jgi:hypothetical protein